MTVMTRRRRSRADRRAGLFVPATACAIAVVAASSAVGDVGVHVAAGPDGIRPGELVDLEVTIGNDGAGLLEDVELQLGLPDGLGTASEAEIEGDCAGSTCDGGELLTFVIDRLAPGTTRTLRYPIAAAGGVADGTVLEFPVTVSDDGSVVGSASASITVDVDRELELAVAEDRGPARPGGGVEYSIAWGLLDVSPGSPGTTLEVPIPAGTTVVATTDGATIDEGVVTWSLGSLGPGDSGEHRLVLAVDDDVTPGSILATTATLANVFGQSVAADVATPVAGDLPLDVRVVASPDPARPGELVDLELTVTNPGGFEVFDVVARIDLPQPTGSFSESEWGVTCLGSTCDGAERLSLAIGDLPAGASRTYSFPLVVSGNAGSGRVLRVEADVLDSFGFQRTASAALRVADDRQLELVAAEDRDPAVAGSSVTWTLSWGARADGPGLFGGTLSLPVPPGTSFVAATDGGTLAGDAVTWELGTLAPGTSGEVRATFTVGPLVDGSMIPARAALDADDAAAVLAETVTRVVADLPLELTVAAGPDPAEPGEDLDVELTVANRGGQPRFGIEVRLDMPDATADFSESVAGATCPGSTCGPRERVRLSLVDLDPGESRTFRLPISVAGSATPGRALPLEAEVLDDSGAIREAAATVLVATERTAGLSLVASDDPARPGDEVVWTLTWASRAGGDGATDAELAMRLPAGLTFLAATDDGVLESTAAGDVVRWPLGAVAPGAGGERRVVTRVDPAFPAGAMLVPEARFDEAGTTAGELVRASDTLRVAADAPLDVEVTGLGQPAAPGGGLDLAVDVRNRGDVPREGVVLVVAYPAGLASISESGLPGTCPGSTCDGGERLTVELGTLAAGETLAFVIPAEVAGGTPAGTVLALDAEAVDLAGVQSRDGDAVVIGTSFRVASPGDVNLDGGVDLSDLIAVLSAWGPCEDADACPEDFGGDGNVGIGDLLVLLSNFD